MLKSFKYGVAATLISLLFLFVMLNLITGCSDWDEPNCVTPSQFMSIITGGMLR